MALTVFYSWQSDLPSETNRKAIAASLKTALTEVEYEATGLTLLFDEATRGEPGSPEIPSTIFEKISKSSIFICDITTINGAETQRRKTPNPNVLIELGFAIATLGWGRVIMLFNKSYGDFPNDLPFDLDKRRATHFLIKAKDDKSGKNALTSSLRTAIETIIAANPVRPSQSTLKPKDQIRREADILNLSNILCKIHLPSMDKIIEKLPIQVIDEAFYYHRVFDEVYSGSSFYLFDGKAKGLLEKLSKIWSKTLSYGNYFYRDSQTRNCCFYIPADEFPSPAAEKAFHRLTKETASLAIVFRAFIFFVREEYHEIDVDALSELALAGYTAYQLG